MTKAFSYFDFSTLVKCGITSLAEYWIECSVSCRSHSKLAFGIIRPMPISHRLIACRLFPVLCRSAIYKPVGQWAGAGQSDRFLNQNQWQRCYRGVPWQVRRQSINHIAPAHLLQTRQPHAETTRSKHTKRLHHKYSTRRWRPPNDFNKGNEDRFITVCSSNRGNLSVNENAAFVGLRQKSASGSSRTLPLLYKITANMPPLDLQISANTLHSYTTNFGFNPRPVQVRGILWVTVFLATLALGFFVFLRDAFVAASSTTKDSKGIPYSFASFATARAFVKLADWIFG